MALTAHYDASDTGKLFTTYSATGVHTGTPTVGDEEVQVWDDELGGDHALMYTTDVEQSAQFVLPADGHLKTGFSELWFQGFVDVYGFWNQIGGAQWNGSTFMSATAMTLIAVVQPRVDASNANVYDNHCLIGTSNQNWGVFFYDDSGIKKVAHYAFSTTNRVAELTCTQDAFLIVIARRNASTLFLSTVDALGSQVDTSTSCGAVSLISPLWLGQNPAGPSAFFEGRIGEFKIWNTADADGNLTAEIETFKTKWLSAVPAQPVRRRSGGVPHVRLGRVLGGRSW